MAAKNFSGLPADTSGSPFYAAQDDKWLAPPFVPKERLLKEPRKDQSVWPGQCCPMFEARYSAAGPVWAECWFCRYADFHLNREKALDVGICCYPRRITGNNTYQ